MQRSISMKKTLFAILILIMAMIMAFNLVSCSEKIDEDDYKYTEEYIAAHTPEAYSFTLTLTDSEGTDTIEYAVSDSFFYQKVKGEGSEADTISCMKKTGTVWKSYNNDDETWTEISDASAAQTSLESLKQGLFSFLQSPVSYISLGVFIKSGNETIGGISCEKYSFTYSGITLSFLINPSTGFCHKWSYSNSANSSENVSYTITNFTTTGVTCPV